MTIKGVTNSISSHIDALTAQIKEEKAKGKEANLGKIKELLLARGVFINLETRGTFADLILKLKNDGREFVAQLEENYNDATVKTKQKSSAVLSMIGGLASGGASGAGALLSAAGEISKYSKAKDILTGLGGAVAAGGQGLNQWTNVNATEKSGQRDLLSRGLEENKALLDEARRAADEADRNAKSLEDAIERARNSNDAVFRTVASNGNS